MALLRAVILYLACGSFCLMWGLFKRRKGEAPDAGLQVDEGPRGVDLRHLEAVRTRVKGTAALIPDSERERVGGTVYVLRREPSNPHDSNAIVVLSDGRKVGYVSAARAAMMAPLLDRIGDDVLVAGMGAMTNSIRLWVDLPKADALRAFVKTLG
jgi:hypothetical protein